MSSIYKQHKNKGFTLIELMVVIAIIGIMATTVSLNFFSNDEGKGAAVSFAEELKVNLEKARKQAMLKNNVIGLVFNQDKMYFVIHSKDPISESESKSIPSSIFNPDTSDNSLDINSSQVFPDPSSWSPNKDSEMIIDKDNIIVNFQTTKEIIWKVDYVQAEFDTFEKEKEMPKLLFFSNGSIYPQYDVRIRSIQGKDHSKIEINESGIIELENTFN